MRYKIKINYKVLTKEGISLKREDIWFNTNIEMKQSINELNECNHSTWLKKHKDINGFDIKVVSMEDTKYSR